MEVRTEPKIKVDCKQNLIRTIRFNGKYKENCPYHFKP